VASICLESDPSGISPSFSQRCSHTLSRKEKSAKTLTFQVLALRLQKCTLNPEVA
jgi:hypothetical protein